MKYIAWGLLTVVTGLIFWLVLIFVVSFLQLNGTLLNDIIQLEATFKDFSWIELVAAFGSFGAAVAAAFSASAANKSSKISEATLSEMEKQRKSAEKIAELQDANCRERSNAKAQADRALIAFALSGICDYFTRVSMFYSSLWRLCHAEKNPVVKPTQERLSNINVSINLPMREIEILHDALKSHPKKLEAISSIYQKIQVSHSRLALYSAGYKSTLPAINCFDELKYNAKAYIETSELFDWARFEERETVPSVDPINMALMAMKVDYCLREKIRGARSESSSYDTSVL